MVADRRPAPCITTLKSPHKDASTQDHVLPEVGFPVNREGHAPVEKNIGHSPQSITAGRSTSGTAGVALWRCRPLCSLHGMDEHLSPNVLVGQFHVHVGAALRSVPRLDVPGAERRHRFIEKEPTELCGTLAGRDAVGVAKTLGMSKAPGVLARGSRIHTRHCASRWPAFRIVPRPFPIFSVTGTVNLRGESTS